MKVLKRMCFLLLVMVFVSVCVCAGGCTLISENENENEKIYKNYYDTLNSEEQSQFDAKLKDITESDYYENLNKKEKEELIEKFVESEKTLKEWASDPVDKTPEEIQEKIDELIANGATPEEIKSAEQEKAYWTVIETVKESTMNNTSFWFHNPELTIRRVNGIYQYQSQIYINADFIKEEIIDGKLYFSNVNCFCDIYYPIRGYESFEEIINCISSAEMIKVRTTCINFNADWHKRFFDEYVIEYSSLKELKELGYGFLIIESWESENDSSHPTYMLTATKDKKTNELLIKYDQDAQSYVGGIIQKICPEFWAQLEIERAKNS